MTSPAVGRLSPAVGRNAREPTLVDAQSGRLTDAGSIPAASIFVRQTARVKEFRNLYLLAGLRGDFERDSSISAETAEVSLLHTLDERWGISPPWGACDSGVDFQSSGDDVLRGWGHVDLRGTHKAPPPSDAPLAGLLRTMWDALELYGRTTLTGADAIVPLDCVGDPLQSRVAGSLVRHRYQGSEATKRVLIQVSTESSDSSAEADPSAILAILSEFVEVEAAMDGVPFASYPPSFSPNPFAYGVEHPWAPSDTDPLRAEIAFPVWTVDDAAWLAEAVCASCARAGETRDVQIALRLLI
jgi:hypothetical protein